MGFDPKNSIRGTWGRRTVSLQLLSMMPYFFQLEQGFLLNQYAYVPEERVHSLGWRQTYSVAVCFFAPVKVAA